MPPTATDTSTVTDRAAGSSDPRIRAAASPGAQIYAPPLGPHASATRVPLPNCIEALVVPASDAAISISAGSPRSVTTGTRDWPAARTSRLPVIPPVSRNRFPTRSTHGPALGQLSTQLPICSCDVARAAPDITVSHPARTMMCFILSRETSSATRGYL